jgi:predicted nucleic acid-binding protein
MSAEFCDTNVILYAYDTSAGVKRAQALALLLRLWQSGEGVVSVQVLQELFVNLTRKIRPSLAVRDAREIVADIATWQVVVPTSADVLEAIDGADRWQVPFGDAMILTAARKAGASVIWSEDLNDGQSYDGLVVKNPFRQG